MKKKMIMTIMILKEIFKNKDESELRDALRRSNGNFDQAANLLLNN